MQSLEIKHFKDAFCYSATLALSSKDSSCHGWVVEISLSLISILLLICFIHICNSLLFVPCWLIWSEMNVKTDNLQYIHFIFITFIVSDAANCVTNKQATHNGKIIRLGSHTARTFLIQTRSVCFVAKRLVPGASSVSLWNTPLFLTSVSDPHNGTTTQQNENVFTISKAHPFQLYTFAFNGWNGNNEFAVCSRSQGTREEDCVVKFCEQLASEPRRHRSCKGDTRLPVRGNEARSKDLTLRSWMSKLPRRPANRSSAGQFQLALDRREQNKRLWKEKEGTVALNSNPDLPISHR